MRSFVNSAYSPDAVPAPSSEAAAFHRALAGYAPTPLRDLGGGVWLKDESNRLGLPAFKVLGASWAAERALRQDPSIHTLVAASAGNHGRAVAHVAALRGLRCRVYLPARAVAARREAIAGEGAEVVMVDGTYEEAVARAAADGAQPGCSELADVGASGPASWVIDGYATLFSELGDDSARGLASPGVLAEGLGLPPRGGFDDSARGLASPGGGFDDSARGLASPGGFDFVLVPVGVGSLGAAAARWGAAVGTAVVAVEPDVAACLTASLVAGAPTEVPTPGTSMAGLDCAEVSAAAWPTLLAGVRGTITVSDAEVRAAMRDLAARGLAIGDSGAAPFAALPFLREAFGDADRVLLIATEGPTDPTGYAATVA